MARTPRPARWNDAAVARALVRWFVANARDLPWRVPRDGRRDPYRVLVSEVMLQQTQVGRVLLRYEQFLGRFPSVGALARAPAGRVLDAWAGLGYYRRARALHALAREVARRGSWPASASELEALPGVGRYTAGAVASLAFGEATPAVDGNVARVLLRVMGRDVPRDSRDGLGACWERAACLARATHRLAGLASNPAGALNEALIELGATVCTVRAPRCGACPIAGACAARARGVQDRIPRPKSRARRRLVREACLVARDATGRVLLERRGAGGLWEGLWQPPTVALDDGEGAREAIVRLAGSLGLGSARGAHEIHHTRFLTSAAVVELTGFALARAAPARVALAWRAPGRRLLAVDATAGLAMPSPHRDVLAAWESRRRRGGIGAGAGTGVVARGARRI